MAYLDKTGLSYFWSKIKAKLAGKQDTLAAGTNITISSSNVISATDTTYSAATASTAGLMSAADKTKLDNIGSASGGSNTKSIASGTSWTDTGVTVTCEPGTWILVAAASFASNATGRRNIMWRTSENANLAHSQMKVSALSGSDTVLHSTAIVYPGSETTYKLCVQQNSGSSLSTEVNWRAVRIA